MANNNTVGTKSNFALLPEIPVDQKLSASEVNEITGFQKSPVQKISNAFVDTDIIVDGTKEYSTAKVIAGATHTITASDDDAIADTLSSEHKQGNELRVRYQFDVDCTLTLTNFESTGNNTGTITPITAGTYDFKFKANARGVNLVIPQNVSGDDTTKLSKTLASDQSVASNVELEKKVAIGVSTFLNSLDVGGGVAIGSGVAGLQTAPTDGLLVEGDSGFGITSPNAKVEIKATSGNQLRLSDTDHANDYVDFEATSTGELIITPSGENVGININPEFAFHVFESSQQNVMKIESGGPACNIFLEDVGSTDTVLFGCSGDDLRFRTDMGSILFKASDTGIETERMRIADSGEVGIGTSNPLAKTDIDQADNAAAIPVLRLDQADISEEMISFETTIGVGNPIEAKGAKTFTETHFIKVELPGGLIRYIPAGTIS